MAHPTPYAGDFHVRVEKLGTPHSTRSFGGDESGEYEYSFNSLGYRGPEYDPSAQHSAFLFGCSHTFGVGVKFDEIWAVDVARRLADAAGLDPTRGCVVNFGEPGASNDYISRAVVTQCGRSTPDLALVHFAPADRTEGFVGDNAFRIGPWMTRGDLARTIRRRRPTRDVRRVLRKRSKKVADYYRYASDHVFVANALRNVLLVQSFCLARGIRLVACWPRLKAIKSGAESWPPAVRDLLDAVDERVVLDTGMEIVGNMSEEADRSLDGGHFAAHVHTRLADAVVTRVTDPTPAS